MFEVVISFIVGINVVVTIFLIKQHKFLLDTALSQGTYLLKVQKKVLNMMLKQCDCDGGSGDEGDVS